MDTSTRPAVERVHPPDALMRLVNPLTRFLLRRGVPRPVAERLLILHYRGRRTGRPYDVPAGYRRIGERLATLTNSGWRVNFRGGRDVELTLRGERVPARAELMEDVHEVARVYDELIGEIGLDQAQRELGIRINVDRRPTRDELAAMVERSGLSVLWYDLDRLR